MSESQQPNLTTPPSSSPKKDSSCPCLLKKFKNALISSYLFSANFVKSTMEKTKTTFNDNLLVKYNTIYLSVVSILSGAAYYIHKSYLSKIPCDKCHNSNMPLHLLGSIAVFLSIMGAGNYYYLKNKSKKD
jgi:hypothetical protein